MARQFEALGFSLAATLGTAGYLRDHGVAVTTLVAKVGEEGLAADAVELHLERQGAAGGQHAAGRGPRADGTHIRSTALAHRVPCLTTLAAARAAAAGMADWATHPLAVRSLQDSMPLTWRPPWGRSGCPTRS